MRILKTHIHIMTDRTLKKKIEDGKSVTRKTDADMIAKMLFENEQLRQIANGCPKCRKLMKLL
jgi:hypothetical protein